MRFILYHSVFRYDVARVFTGHLAEALRALGHEAVLLDVTTADAPDELARLCDHDGQVVIFSINGLLMALPDDHPAQRALQVFWLLDHPLYHMARLGYLAEAGVILTIDPAHARFLQGLGIRHAMPLLHAGTRPSVGAVPWAARQDRLLFPASVMPQAQLRTHQHNELRPHLSDDHMDLYESLCAMPTATDIEVIRHYREATKIDELTREACLILPAVFDSLRNQRRLAYATTALEKKLPLTVCGAGWDEVLPKARSVGPVAFADMPNLMTNFRWVLHDNPLFSEGLHERPLTAALAGCGVVCNGTPALQHTLSDAGVPMMAVTSPIALADTFRERPNGDHTITPDAPSPFDWQARARDLVAICDLN